MMVFDTVSGIIEWLFWLSCVVTYEKRVDFLSILKIALFRYIVCNISLLH